MNIYPIIPYFLPMEAYVSSTGLDSCKRVPPASRNKASYALLLRTAPAAKREERDPVSVRRQEEPQTSEWRRIGYRNGREQGGGWKGMDGDGLIHGGLRVGHFRRRSTALPNQLSSRQSGGLAINPTTVEGMNGLPYC